MENYKTILSACFMYNMKCMLVDNQNIPEIYANCKVYYVENTVVEKRYVGFERTALKQQKIFD